MWLLVLYVPRELSFISTHFFVLNLDGWFGVLSSKSIFYMYIPLLSYYINPRSSIIFWLFSVDRCRSFGQNSVFSVSEVFFGEVLETFVTFSEILLPMKSAVASVIFWNALFEAVLSASVADCLAWSRSFWLYSLRKFFPYIFINIVSHF